MIPVENKIDSTYRITINWPNERETFNDELIFNSISIHLNSIQLKFILEL